MFWIVLEEKQAKHATGFKEAFIFLLNDIKSKNFVFQAQQNFNIGH